MQEILKKIPFFADLSEEDLNLIRANVKMDYFPEGHVIFEEGDAGDIMYIIKRGKVQVLRENSIVAELGDGAFFGEMALVSDVPRNATVKTLSDVEVLTLSSDNFKSLVNNNPSIASMVSVEVIKRVNDNF